jgi:TetR/AcrR family fatty acid metabolism transcriptional regulator
MAPRNDQLRDEKRETILDGAVRVIAAKGFHRTRVSEVAKAAGVADGTIYLYFEGKDALLRAVYERAMNRFLERGLRALAEEAGARAQLERFIQLHLECVGEDRELAAVFQVDLRKSIPFLQELSLGLIQRYLDALATILYRGQQEGVFLADLPARELAKMVFGVLDELATNWVLSERNYRLESSAADAITFISRALGAEEPERSG